MSKHPAQVWPAGYTLMEVLIVVAIMAVLFGVGLAAYGRFDSVKKVEQAALTFGMYLRETQKMADAGRKPATGCSGDFTGVQVTAAGSTGIYQQIAYCPLGQILETKTLNSANNFEDPFNVTFNTVGRGVTVPSSTDGQTIITDTHHSVEYQITVETGGAITVERV